MNLKSNKIIIPVAIIIVGFLISASIINNKKSEPQILSAQEAAERALNYVSQVIAAQGATDTAVLINTTTTDSGVYQVGFKIKEYEYNLFVSRDGKYLFPEAYDLSTATEESSEGEGTANNQETVKNDRPDVKLFVMSYCPYGLQAEKMYLPVYDLLKDKADMGIYFVSYAMHEKQEIDENLRQYCIQKESKEKYYNYLSCFVKDGEYEKCLVSADIDMTKLNNCQTDTDKNYKITENYNDKSTWLSGYYPLFDVNADLNEQYGVQGSPTVVINGSVVNINPRSPEKFKEVVCGAFDVSPEECSQTLSTDSASVSFGDSGQTSSGSCE